MVSFGKGCQGGTGAICVYMMSHQPKTLLTLSLTNIHEVNSALYCEQNEIIDVVVPKTFDSFWKTLFASEIKSHTKQQNKTIIIKLTIEKTSCP